MLFQGKQEQPPGFPFLPNCRLCLGNHLTVNIGNAMALASGHTNASQVQSLILSGVVTGMPRQWCRPHCGHQHAGGLALPASSCNPAFVQRVWSGIRALGTPQAGAPGSPYTSHSNTESQFTQELSRPQEKRATPHSRAPAPEHVKPGTLNPLWAVTAGQVRLLPWHLITHIQTEESHTACHSQRVTLRCTRFSSPCTANMATYGTHRFRCAHVHTHTWKSLTLG